jgi:hypothetical protein
MSTSVGKLNIEVNVQLAKMQAQFDQLNRKTKEMARKQKSAFSGMAGSVKASMGLFAAALAPTAIIAFVKNLANLASDIVHLSDAAGIGARDFAILNLHFLGAGIQAQEVSTMFVKLQKATSDVAMGNKLLGDSFAVLGIDPIKLSLLELQRQMEVISIAYVNSSDKAAAFGAIMTILGTKQAPKLRSSLITLGKDGLDAVKELYSEFAPTDEDLRKIEAAATAFDHLVGKMKYAAITWLALKERGPTALTESIMSDFYNKTGLGNKDSFSGVPSNGFSDMNVVDSSLAAAALAKEQQNKLKAVEGDTLEMAKRKERVAKADQERMKRKTKEQEELSKWAKANVDANETNIAQELSLVEKYEDMAQPLRVYQRQIDEINALYSLGGISAEAYTKDLAMLREEMAKQDADTEAAAERYRDMANPLRQYQMELLKIEETKKKGIITDKEAIAASAAVQKDMGELQKKILKDAEGADVTAAQKSMTDALNQMWNNVSDRAGQAFADMVLTGKSSFADLAGIISRTMIEIVARMAIINPLMNALFGGFGGFGILPAFFGSGAKLAGAAADGGPVRGGSSYLVGEEGPEIFTPNSTGAIIPNGAAVALGGGGSPTFIYNIGSGVTQSQLMPILRNQERTIISKIRDNTRRG